jgi:hypothetical protein
MANEQENEAPPGMEKLRFRVVHRASTFFHVIFANLGWSRMDGAGLWLVVCGLPTPEPPALR